MADKRLNLEEVTLAVLAGGRGKRMGLPKSLLRVGDRPLLLWLLDRWSWQGPTMLVTAPGVEHPPGSERFTQEVTDPIADAGPLRGVVTALEQARTDRLIITTCDMPLLTCLHFNELLNALSVDRKNAAVMCRRKDEAEEIIEPFPMAMRRREAFELVGTQFSRGERSPAALARQATSQVAVVSPHWDVRAWTNLNYPGELANFLASIAI